MHALNISSSIGVAIYPEHGDNELVLAKNADLAMYYAKEHGRDQVCFYQDLTAQGLVSEPEIVTDDGGVSFF